MFTHILNINGSDNLHSIAKIAITNPQFNGCDFGQVRLFAAQQDLRTNCLSGHIVQKSCLR